MTKTQQKASRAKALRESKIFQEFHQQAVDEAQAVFANPSSREDEISEAHAMIRALAKLKAQMDRAMMDAKIESKRAQRS